MILAKKIFSSVFTDGKNNNNNNNLGTCFQVINRYEKTIKKMLIKQREKKTLKSTISNENTLNTLNGSRKQSVI